MMHHSKSKKYWEDTALRQKELKISLTHSDKFLPGLETEAILSFISPGDDVIEFGCGACDNALPYISKCRNYTGVELIPQFIEMANETIKKQKLVNANIIQSDGYEYVLQNPLTQTTLITQRFIINLKDRSTQLDFFKQVKKNFTAKKLKLIICEGFKEELDNLNELRIIAGLDKIEEAPYNNFLDVEFMNELQDVGFQIIEEVNFNIYFFITRLFNNQKFSNEENNIAKTAFNLQKTKKLALDYNVSYSKVVLLELRRYRV